MPAEGGVPRRLTTSATLDRDDLADRMGPNNVVMTWRNTAPEVVFRSRWRSFNPFIGELYTVGLDGDVPSQLPVPRGGVISYSPDDRKIAYNRIFREFRTWKQYRGGMADDIWIFDPAAGTTENITNHPAQDIFPMWAPNGRIYFVSERTPRANLFSYDLGTKQTKQVTQFTDYDVKFPSLGRGAIVFEQAGRKRLAYCSDCKEVPEAALALIRGVEVFVVDALWKTTHWTHMSLDEALTTARRVGAAQTYLTHLTDQYDHDLDQAELPPNVWLAWDGLCVALT